MPNTHAPQNYCHRNFALEHALEQYDKIESDPAAPNHLKNVVRAVYNAQSLSAYTAYYLSLHRNNLLSLVELFCTPEDPSQSTVHSFTQTTLNKCFRGEHNLPKNKKTRASLENPLTRREYELALAEYAKNPVIEQTTLVLHATILAFENEISTFAKGISFHAQILKDLENIHDFIKIPAFAQELAGCFYDYLAKHQEEKDIRNTFQKGLEIGLSTQSAFRAASLDSDGRGLVMRENTCPFATIISDYFSTNITFSDDGNTAIEAPEKSALPVLIYKLLLAENQHRQNNRPKLGIST